jgi:hypothetical protein
MDALILMEKIETGCRTDLNSPLFYYPMQAKYVPRFVSKTQEQQAQPDVPAAPLSPSNRWAPLVNTSLPAKQAPILPPSTLATLTKVSIKNTQVKPAPSADDFPTLGVPKVPSEPASAKPTFSQLSKQWAVQKEEDDKKAKEETEKIASEERHLRSLKEKDAAIARDIRKFGFIPLPAMNRVQLTEPERVRFSDEEDEIDPFDDGMPEEEEEEEEEDDMNWNVRRSRHDLY